MLAESGIPEQGSVAQRRRAPIVRTQMELSLSPRDRIDCSRIEGRKAEGSQARRQQSRRHALATADQKVATASGGGTKVDHTTRLLPATQRKGSQIDASRIENLTLARKTVKAGPRALRQL